MIPALETRFAAPAASWPAAPAADAPWHRLDELPRPLWLPALIASVGRTDRRLLDVGRWHAALRQGSLPDAQADAGAPEALAPMRRAIADLELAALCHAVPAAAEQVVRTMLWHLDRIIDHQPRLSRPQAIALAATEFRAEWEVERVDAERIQALLRALGEQPHLRWDQLKGLLAHRGTAQAERIAEHLARLPELTELIDRLGRAQRAVSAPPAQALQAAQAPKPLGSRSIETRLPGMPGELKGIHLSARLERMLGSEAAQLMHPVLHKLWRARRAEGRLLAYDTEAVLRDRRPDPLRPPESAAVAAPPRPLERGPLIVCLDTSGSMRGAPEHIAKAVVLQAARTARSEGRGCLLIAFGGPQEIVERELAQGAGGTAALLELLGQSFDGGTDVQAPIERAVQRVHEARWASADLLIVSDGEFGCTPATLDALDSARTRFGLRVQGILIGDRETMGLMEVADAIHWLRHWRAHAEGRAPRESGFSPVHSKSLTALYFPNALSGRAARHHPPPKPS